MVKFGKQIARHKTLVVIICVLLLIPSAFGYIKTRINYDLLSYLPETLEPSRVRTFLLMSLVWALFLWLLWKALENKDVAKLEEKIENVEHVKDVLWAD